MEVPDRGSPRAAPFWMGTWYVQPMLNRIGRDGEEHTLEPRVMDVLVMLATAEGAVVSRDELFASVWRDVVVNDDALTRAVSELRRCLGDAAHTPSYVETIRGRGYRLVAQVRRETRPGPASGDPPRERSHLTAHAPLVRPARQWRWPILLAGLGLLVTALVVGAVQSSDRADVADDPPRWAEPITTFPGQEVQPALSPDGARVAFAWDRDDGYDIYLKQLDGATVLRLTDDPAFESYPAWAPDGTTIAFFRDGDTPGIFSVPSLGGTARRLYRSPSFIQSLHWSPDGGSIVFSMRPSEGAPFKMFLLDVATGAAARLTDSAASGAAELSARFSPDGRRIAYVQRAPAGAQDVFLFSIDTGRSERLTLDQLGIRGLDWSSDDEIVFASYRSGTYGLWKVNTRSKAHSWVATRGERVYFPSASVETGALVYQQLQYEKNVWELSLDRPGGTVVATRPLITSTRWDCEAFISPDDRRIVFTSARSGNLELWLSHRDGRDPVQLTHFGGPFVGNPRWSPDGRYVAFYASPAGRSSVYVMDVERRMPRRLTDPEWNARATGWSPDGRYVYFSSDRNGGWQLWRVEVATGAAFQVTNHGALSAAVSPDGTFLYLTRPGTPGLWRSRLVEGRAVDAPKRILPSLVTADWGNWSPSNGGVYYVERTSEGPAVAFLDLGSGKRRLVAPVPHIASPSLSVSPDGRSILYGRIERSQSDLMLLRPGPAEEAL